MKNIINILLILAISFLGWQFFNLYIRNISLEKSSNELSVLTESIKIENENLASDISYFSNPENQEKELKSKTNYKKSDEKMIIIIPPVSAINTISQ